MKISQLTEARYAGKYSNEDVYNQYDRHQYDRQVSRDRNEDWDDMVLDVIDIVTKDSPDWKGNDFVEATFYTETPGGTTQDQVTNLIKQFHVDHNIPFGEVDKLTPDALYDDSIVWTAYIRYYGH